MVESQVPPETNLVYSLQGEVDSVSVFDLAPALLSLGQLIQDANQILNPRGDRIAVNARPFRKGSFEVDIVVLTQQLASEPIIAGLVTAYSIPQILKAVGLVADTSKKVVSAIDAMRKLGAKPSKVDAVEGGHVKYSVGDNSVIVDQSVHILLQSPTITNSIVGALERPMRGAGVTSVRSYLRGQQPETEAVVSREDVEALRRFVEPAAPEAQSVPAGEPIVTRVFLNPKRGSFDGDPRNWSFSRKGAGPITATIRDELFLDDLRNGRRRLHYTDLLEVELVETQSLRGTEVSSSFEIRRVLDYRQGGEGPIFPGRAEPEH